MTYIARAFVCWQLLKLAGGFLTIVEATHWWLFLDMADATKRLAKRVDPRVFKDETPEERCRRHGLAPRR